MTQIKIIKTHEDHAEALARMAALMDTDPAPDTDEDLELQAMAALIEAYEAKHFKIDTGGVTPLDIIKFRMEQSGLTQKDMPA